MHASQEMALWEILGEPIWKWTWRQFPPEYNSQWYRCHSAKEMCSLGQVCQDWNLSEDEEERGRKTEREDERWLIECCFIQVRAVAAPDGATETSQQVEVRGNCFLEVTPANAWEPQGIMGRRRVTHVWERWSRTKWTVDWLTGIDTTEEEKEPDIMLSKVTAAVFSPTDSKSGLLHVTADILQ